MLDRLRERSYPQEILNKETKQALDTSRNDSRNRSKKNKEDNSQKGIPLVLTYDMFLCQLEKLQEKIFPWFIKVLKQNRCLLQILQPIFAVLALSGATQLELKYLLQIKD